MASVGKTGWRGNAGNGTDLSPAPVVTNTTGLPIRTGVANIFGRVPTPNQPPKGRKEANASGNPSINDTPQVEPPKSPYGRPRILGVGQETAWRGGLDFANDKLITTDRHGILNSGTERGGGRGSGLTDPPMDGPPRPALRLVQRTINWQVGNPLATQDEQPGENRPYTRNQQGMFVGEQGSGWSPVYGGVPGLWQPYGSYEGLCAGPVVGIQSPVAQGGAGDGPHKVWSGPPHGLHSQTAPDYAATLGYYLAVPQQVVPRMDRPSNSTSGGQSYSQTVQPQGQTGTAAQQASGAPPGPSGTSSGVNWRVKPKGWRGQTNR